MVTFVRSRAPELSMPPPSEPEWFPTIDTSVRVAVPSLKSPPAFLVVEFPDTTAWLSVSTAFFVTRSPPPSSVVLPPVIVTPITVADALPRRSKTRSIEPPLMMVVPEPAPRIVTPSAISKSPLSPESSLPVIWIRYSPAVSKISSTSLLALAARMASRSEILPSAPLFAINAAIEVTVPSTTSFVVVTVTVPPTARLCCQRSITVAEKIPG